MKLQPTQTAVRERTKDNFDNFMRNIRKKWYADNDEMLNAYNKIAAN